MDVDSLVCMLEAIERNEKNLFAKDLLEPSPLAAEILSGVIAYLDDAPLEERRTRAVYQRRWLDRKRPQISADLTVGNRSRTRGSLAGTRNADELHDALVELDS